MLLSELGKIVESEWLKSAEIRKEVILDAYVVMPNHFHAIVYFRRGVGPNAQSQQIGLKAPDQKVESSAQNINEDPAAQPEGLAALPEGSGFSPKTPTLGMQARSLASLVSGFKTRVTMQVRKRGYQGNLWQRNYYEHVIRNEEDYNHIREYIMNNPANWAKDSINPEYPIK